MKAVILIATLVGASIPLTGCGELHRRNDLFSMAVNGTMSAGVPSTASAEAPLPPEPEVSRAEARPRPSAPRPRQEAAEAAREPEAQLAGLDRPDPPRSAPASPPPEDDPEPAANPATTDEDQSPAQPTVATSDQILAGLLRVWNKVASKNLSSEVLFGIMPEDLDDRAPPPPVDL